MSETQGIRCEFGHIHGTVQAVQACAFAQAHPEEVAYGSSDEGKRRTAIFTETTARETVQRPATVAPRAAQPTFASDQQLDTIKRLGGHIPAGQKISRTRASEMIDRLISAKEERDRRFADAQQRQLERATVHQTSLGIPAELIFQIRQGRYAVSMNGTKKLEFIRLVILKNTHRLAGYMQVQTQHGDMLRKRAYISPIGDVSIVTHGMPADMLTAILMQIIVDQRGAAILYGREKGMCCRCGKQLTDERSRHYGIGPECEKHWPQIISDIDEREGAFQAGEYL